MKENRGKKPVDIFPITNLPEGTGFNEFKKAWESCVPQQSDIQFGEILVYGTGGIGHKKDFDDFMKDLASKYIGIPSERQSR